jgi:secondary thiamine-phosphate synthase enzyme
MSWFVFEMQRKRGCHTHSTHTRFQKSLTLPSRSRGSYLVTEDITKQLPEIKNFKTGLLNLFVQHTSCALSLNENWDQDVRADMSDALDRIVPEDKKGQGLYRHDAEGSDDMPVCASWMKAGCVIGAN